MARIDLHQLDEFDNQFAPNAASGDVPVWDGAQFVPRSLNNFEDNFFYHSYQTTADVSTSSTTPQSYFTTDTQVLPVGLYRIGVLTIWRTDSGNTRINVQTLVDGVNPFNHDFNTSSHKNDADMRDYMYAVAFFQVTTEKVVTIDVDYFRDGANGSVYLYGGGVEVWRIGA